MTPFHTTLSIVALVMVSPLRAGEPPLPPQTRPAMKQALEEQKRAKPRLPLPALTEAEKNRLGNRRVVNNGRMRTLYLPEDVPGSDFFRGRDPAMTLDPTFKTMLFWIVSRVNNCRY